MIILLDYRILYKTSGFKIYLVFVSSYHFCSLRALDPLQFFKFERDTASGVLDFGIMELRAG
jgi:hypothetical protein